MTEELKRAVAKSLLIAQLFCPINIKFVNQSYEGYKKISDNMFVACNNLIIEKTNPFDDRNIFFQEDLLEYENRDEAVDALMKSIDRNWKLSPKIKENTNFIRNFVEDNSHIDLKSLYNLLGKLEVKKMEDLSSNTMMLTIKDAIVNENMPSGVETPHKANIYVNDEYVNFLEDKQFQQVFFHELVHLSGNFQIYRGNQSVGIGLTEGMTSFIEHDYCPDMNAPDSYFFLRNCVKMLVEIVGPDILLNCFSESNLVKLNDALKDKGVLEDDFIRLIINMDRIFYEDSVNNKQKVDNIYTEIIDFYEVYNCLVTNEESRFIYSMYLENIKKSFHAAAEYEDIVFKVYYNSKLKQEYPKTYIQYRIPIKELSLLNCEYKVSSMNEEYANVRIAIDEFLMAFSNEKTL